MGVRVVGMVGQRFGLLIVIEELEPRAAMFIRLLNAVFYLKTAIIRAGG